MFLLSSPDSDCFAGSRENQNTMITMPISLRGLRQPKMKVAAWIHPIITTI